LAKWLDATIGNQSIIVIIIGLVSAVVDNIPLVAASMGMYPLTQYPTDSFIWEFMAYCAGTGGSILIIGSAAGVAAMGLEKIEFFGMPARSACLPWRATLPVLSAISCSTICFTETPCRPCSLNWAY